MVNTRILEQRLGWKASADGEETTPEVRPILHGPVLQGRVNTSAGLVQQRGNRRAAVQDLWDRLPDISAYAGMARHSRFIPDFDKGSLAGTVFDQLRTQLLRVAKTNGWRRIGITSPMRGAGRSFVAAGLATSIARLDTTTVLLLDADLEEAGLANLLGVDAAGALEPVLMGDAEAEGVMQRWGANLALVLNDEPVHDASELMYTPEAVMALRGIIDALQPNLVIVDMPPLLSDAVAPSLFGQLDAVFLVSDGLKTRPSDIIECERILEGQVPLLGIVLNKSEDPDPRPRARRTARR